jgi:hypothetical protein
MAKTGKKELIITKDMIEKAEALGLRGLNQEQIALCLGMGVSTFFAKKNKCQEFADAVKRGQAKGLSITANALFENAKSGNVTAQIFIMKCKGGWREAKEDLNIKITKQEDAIKELG